MNKHCISLYRKHPEETIAWCHPASFKVSFAENVHPDARVHYSKTPHCQPDLGGQIHCAQSCECQEREKDEHTVGWTSDPMWKNKEKNAVLLSCATYTVNSDMKSEEKQMEINQILIRYSFWSFSQLKRIYSTMWGAVFSTVTTQQGVCMLPLWPLSSTASSHRPNVYWLG